jgi:TatD DNase family protein
MSTLLKTPRTAHAAHAAHAPLIDIGANLSNARFRDDLDAVLARAAQAGVGHVIVTGTSIGASRAAFALTQRHPAMLSSTAGVHPHDAKHWDGQTEAAIAELAGHRAVLAIGECGLDFNRNFSPKDQQLACYQAQLQLAADLKKPVFLHQRDAHTAFITILKRYRPALTGAVVHCFTGTLTEMREYLDLGCHIGITGWVCDERRGAELQQAVKFIPLDRLMIETDAPFLTPRTLSPKPASNRNEPAYLPAVLATLSGILDISAQELAAHTVKTTRDFFGLAEGL